MALKMQTGHNVFKNVRDIEGDAVRFMTPDDRCMFEVRICADGRSIEVTAVDACQVDGVLYAGVLEIRPKVANSLVLRTPLYDDQ